MSQGPFSALKSRWRTILNALIAPLSFLACCPLHSLHPVVVNRVADNERDMRATAKKIGILLVGWAFILFGVAGLILPILHGTVFLLIGLTILSSEYVWAHRLLSKIRNRFPSVTARLEQATTAAHEWVSKVFHRRRPPTR